jgi:hypothetical protein
VTNSIAHHDDLTSACRDALASLRTGPRAKGSIPRRVVSALSRRGLVAEYTAGQIQATARAAGYCADPSTFDD